MNAPHSNRPTPEQVAEAREWFSTAQLVAMKEDGFEHSAEMARVLLAATAPIPFNEIQSVCVEVLLRHVRNGCALAMLNSWQSSCGA